MSVVPDVLCVTLTGAGFAVPDVYVSPSGSVSCTVIVSVATMS